MPNMLVRTGTYLIFPFLGKPHNLKALDEILSIGLETNVRRRKNVELTTTSLSRLAG